MSFVDLATLAMHRRNEMEARIQSFVSKCDHATNGIMKLKGQAYGLVQQLNCEPSQLKERFLNCMKLLDEFNYLITDFNIAVSKLEENSCSSLQQMPVHDDSNKVQVQTPTLNLMDILTEPMPSTSASCSNNCPPEIPTTKKTPKEEQILINFSSSSCSAESVPGTKIEKQVQYDIDDEIHKLSLRDEALSLPAQTVLRVDNIYPATIMNIDGESLWVITENVDEAYRLMLEMTEHYKNHAESLDLKVQDVATLTYCAYYDLDTDCYYRALIISLTDGDNMEVELFLMDTGEIRLSELCHIQPLTPQFCIMPPFARCCHLAGVEPLSSYQDKELQKMLEKFMKSYIGTSCKIEVEDNTSESLGVYVRLVDSDSLNELFLNEVLRLTNGAVDIEDDVHSQASRHQQQDSPELLDDIDITLCPEHDDPVEAVTGYHYRDEADICKHYKGGPEKTCFKGVRCKKRHVIKHPDGWTLDRVEVPVVCKTMPLPAPDTWHKVLVTCVCHFNTVWVQFIDEKPKEEVSSFGVVLPPNSLDALVRDMNSPAARMSYKPLTICPAPGELVAAIYPQDDQWYRARVIESTRPDQCIQVKYIDYGNTVWVKEDCVRVLEPRYLVLPEQAVRCRLVGIVPLRHCSKQWAAVKQSLSEMVQDQVLNAHIIVRGYDDLDVELYDQDGYSIAELMAAKNIVNLQSYTVQVDDKVRQKIAVP